MSEENKVTIDGEEYSFEGLNVETQANIARVNELRREVSALRSKSTSVKPCYRCTFKRSLTL